MLERVGAIVGNMVPDWMKSRLGFGDQVQEIIEPKKTLKYVPVVTDGTVWRDMPLNDANFRYSHQGHTPGYNPSHATTPYPSGYFGTPGSYYMSFTLEGTTVVFDARPMGAMPMYDEMFQYFDRLRAEGKDIPMRVVKFQLMEKQVGEDGGESYVDLPQEETKYQYLIVFPELRIFIKGFNDPVGDVSMYRLMDMHRYEDGYFDSMK